jgi:GNAT superfamily N-acetyltransferase
MASGGGPTVNDDDGAAVSVVTGSAEHLALVERVAAMINEAYGRARVDPDEVRGRLASGDRAGANRVLHLGFCAGELVGCVSSTLQAGWTKEGCGHWGLLVVAVAAQGGGVATALVRAAEARLVAGGCAQVGPSVAMQPRTYVRSEPWSARAAGAGAGADRV